MKRVHEASGLGTLLRHLIELLDGGVEAVYREQGMNCRSRFTPVIRHLELSGPSTLRQIADASGLSHSAISQTVAEMIKQGFVESAPGRDARERIVRFTPAGEAALPQLHAVWDAIWAAANELSDDLNVSLTDVLQNAIYAVEGRPFRDRVVAKMAENLELESEQSVEAG